MDGLINLVAAACTLSAFMLGTLIHLFEAPWKSVAYVLCYIRGGLLADKPDHFRMRSPSEHDLLFVRSEVEPHAAMIVA